MPQQAETVVISVGGSLIVPSAIDTDFLGNLKTLVASQITDRNRQFVIIAGGGSKAPPKQPARELELRLPQDVSRAQRVSMTVIPLVF